MRREYERAVSVGAAHAIRCALGVISAISAVKIFCSSFKRIQPIRIENNRRGELAHESSHKFRSFLIPGDTRANRKHSFLLGHSLDYLQRLQCNRPVGSFIQWFGHQFGMKSRHSGQN